MSIPSRDKSYESLEVDLVRKLNVPNSRVSTSMIAGVRHMLVPGLASMAPDVDALRFTRVSVVNLPVMTEF